MLSMVSKDTRRVLKEWLDSKFHVTIPGVRDGQTFEELLAEVQGVMSSVTRGRRVISMTVDCSLNRISDLKDGNDLDEESIQEDPDGLNINEIIRHGKKIRREIESHYAIMRVVAGIVISTNLISLTLKNLRIDGVLARTLGDMLQRSPHLTKIVLDEVNFIDEFNLKEDQAYFTGSFFHLKEISFDNSCFFGDDDELPNTVSLLGCLDSATQLTSLDLTDEQLDDYRPDDKLTGGRYNSMLNNLFMTDRSYKTLIKLDLSNNKLQSLISIVQTL